MPPIATALGAGSLLLNARLAPESVFGPNALWIMGDDETRLIGEPLSRIAARHVPLTQGKANDVSDGIEAAVASVGYVLHNLLAAKEHAAGGTRPEPSTSPSESPPPAPPAEADAPPPDASPIFDPASLPTS